LATVVERNLADAGPPAQGARVEIATDRCKGCELCVGVCPKHVLELDRTKVNALGHHPIRLTDQGACTSCALCARICPDTVFTIYAIKGAA
jgi:2-oxoglutarate ferredoxin oxidoreductase subunit delta